MEIRSIWHQREQTRKIQFTMHTTLCGICDINNLGKKNLTCSSADGAKRHQTCRRSVSSVTELHPSRKHTFTSKQLKAQIMEILMFSSAERLGTIHAIHDGRKRPAAWKT